MKAPTLALGAALGGVLLLTLMQLKQNGAMGEGSSFVYKGRLVTLYSWEGGWQAAWSGAGGQNFQALGLTLDQAEANAKMMIDQGA